MGDTTVYSYDGSGNQQTVTDGLGHTATTLYDALNRPTTMISAVSGTTTITYDAGGRETSLTDPVGNKTQWAYDYHHAYYSPSHKGYRSPGQALMPEQGTDVLGLSRGLTDENPNLLACGPFALCRRAA